MKNKLFILTLLVIILILGLYACLPTEIYVPEVSMESTAEAFFEPDVASGVARERLYNGVYRVVDFEYGVVCYDKIDQPLTCIELPKGEK